MSNDFFIDFKQLWSTLTDHFQLGLHSIHGPDHWKKVEQNGLMLAKHANADLDVIKLFAVFHDSERQSEGYDPDHGFRAAELVSQLHGDLFRITDTQFEKLVFACQLHNHGEVSDDATIGCCWDADRLELTRVGIRPMKERMSTYEGKRLAE